MPRGPGPAAALKAACTDNAPRTSVLKCAITCPLAWWRPPRAPPTFPRACRFHAPQPGAATPLTTIDALHPEPSDNHRWQRAITASPRVQEAWGRWRDKLHALEVYARRNKLPRVSLAFMPAWPRAGGRCLDLAQRGRASGTGCSAAACFLAFCHPQPPAPSTQLRVEHQPLSPHHTYHHHQSLPHNPLHPAVGLLHHCP